jgi:hypothetical protein
MSEVYIKDGAGSGLSAKVSKEQRLHTLSVSETIAAHHAFDGHAYNFNTGTINLTSANKSALAYIKNNEDDPLVITGFFYLLGNTDGTGDTLVQIERNPTGGTLISGGTAQAPVNRDFGSNNTLTADALKGAEGSTLTGGTVAIESIFSGVGRQAVIVGAIVLRKGNSVGITITPPASTTDMDVQLAMALYKATELTQDT